MIVLLSMVSPRFNPDDNGLYIAFIPPSHKDPATFNRAIANIESCVLDIRSWIAFNILKLNNPKTELLLIGSHYCVLVPCSPIQIGNKQVPPSVSTRNLGVIFDSGMTLEALVNSVVSAAFYHIKNIGSIRNHLKHVHAHATSRLDHCYMVYRIRYCTKFKKHKMQQQ